MDAAPIWSSVNLHHKNIINQIISDPFFIFIITNLGIMPGLHIRHPSYFRYWLWRSWVSSYCTSLILFKGALSTHCTNLSILKLILFRIKSKFLDNVFFVIQILIQIKNQFLIKLRNNITKQIIFVRNPNVFIYHKVNDNLLVLF